MLTFSQMTIRFFIALLLGAFMGLERERIGKEAGIRTALCVSAGAAIFAMIALTLPYIVALSPSNLPDVIARNSGFLGVIANIVVGIGFLGTGIIIKTQEHVRGLTTAAMIWATAAVGVLVGIGLVPFACVAAFTISSVLYLMRKLKLYEYVRPGHRVHNDA